jgi:hypothetical protein
MAALWILILIVATYLITISLVVIGQEVHVTAAIALFVGVAYGAYKLFQARLTRL